MNKQLLFFVSCLILSSCSEPKPEETAEQKLKNELGRLDDSLATATISSTTDTAKLNTNETYRDINQLESKTGNVYFDSLNQALFTDPNTQVEIKRDVCGGDYCQSIRTLKQNDLTLHFIKGNGGEYGFSNEGYVLEKGRLVFAREFDVEIEEFPTETTNTLWMVRERVYDFKPGKVMVKERKTHTRDLYEFDLTMKKELYKPIQNDSSTSDQAVLNRMTMLLEMENMDY